MFVKICGITRAEDALAACERGADAIGFVFWPESPRVIDVPRARAIARSLPGTVDRVGVFVNQPGDDVNEIAEQVGLTAVQLHGDETAEYAASMRLRIIKSVGAEADVREDGWPAGVTWLVDVLDPERRGGTGVRVDWAAAARMAARHRVLLAGGLSAANVGDAIARVRPYGIDVSSGVESSPGIKDPARMKALFEAVYASSNQ